MLIRVGSDDDFYTWAIDWPPCDDVDRYPSHPITEETHILTERERQTGWYEPQAEV